MSVLSRRKMIVEGVLLSLAPWLVLSVAAIARPPHIEWTSETVESVLLLSWVAEFLYLKAWLMVRRTFRYTRLGTALALTNISFAVAYQLGVCFTFWPHLLVIGELRRGVRYAVAIVVTWTVCELVLTQDPPESDASDSGGYLRLAAENDEIRQQLSGGAPP